MTLPATITLTQAGLTPTLTLECGVIAPPSGGAQSGGGAALVQQAAVAVSVSSGSAVMMTTAGVAPAQIDALPEAAAFLGIAAQSGAPGAIINVVTCGFVADTSFGWALGLPIFVLDGGALSQTPPTSGVSLIAGYPQEATAMVVRPQIPIQL